jgi:hypothetical protein
MMYRIPTLLYYKLYSKCVQSPLYYKYLLTPLLPRYKHILSPPHKHILLTPLQSYYNDLQFMLAEYERITDRIIPVTTKLLAPYLQTLDLKLRPGMVTLTWTSMNIDQYKNSIYNGLRRLEEMVLKINDLVENRIQKNLKVQNTYISAAIVLYYTYSIYELYIILIYYTYITSPKLFSRWCRGRCS